MGNLLHQLGKRLIPIVASVCALAIILVWAAVMQRMAFEKRQAVAAAMEANSNLAFAFEQQVTRTLRTAEQIASFVRQQYQSLGPALDLSGWLQGVFIRDAAFTIISVVDDTGAVIHSTHDTLGVSYADREFFTAQRDSTSDELFVSAPVLGRVSGAWRVPMSLRISGEDGSFAGVVVMSVDPASFGESFIGSVGSKGFFQLSGNDGIVRARIVGRLRSFGEQVSRMQWLEQANQSGQGCSTDDGQAIDGEARIVCYRPIAGHPLVVAVGTAYTEELAPVWQRRKYYITAATTASISLLAFAVLVMLLLMRQRKASEAIHASEALYRVTFHQAATGIAHVATDGRILRVNEKFAEMLGYDREELHQRNLIELTDRPERDAVRTFMKGRLDRKAAGRSEIEKSYRCKDGRHIWVAEAVGVVRDARGVPDYLVAVSQDITGRKELEAKLAYDASHDALTGLPNRNFFQVRLADAMNGARSCDGKAAVLYLDLDGFKQVNDVHGHAVGDLLLRSVAERLVGCVRAEDTVARVGGDEFAVVLRSVGSERTATRVADAVVDALSRPYTLGLLHVRISASVGVAVYPIHGDDAESLVRHADAAMYGRKGFNRETCRA